MRGMTLGPWVEVDTNPTSVQRIMPPSRSARFEGVGFSGSGNTLAIATSETNSVLLFRRRADGLFEDMPYQVIGNSRLDYPHDVSFSNWNDGELLAVAQRTGAIAIYSKHDSNRDYTSSPVFEISGQRSKLAFSDGVAFVPPYDRYLAACNLELGTISFFRTVSLSPANFRKEPEFELKHESIYHPDGLGFSNCGKWLACANHGKNTVAIFRRRNRFLAGERLVSIRSRSRLSKTHNLVIHTRSHSHRRLITSSSPTQEQTISTSTRRSGVGSERNGRKFPCYGLLFTTMIPLRKSTPLIRWRVVQKELPLTEALWRFAAHRSD